jgi:hypothetical protein
MTDEKSGSNVEPLIFDARSPASDQVGYPYAR